MPPTVAITAQAFGRERVGVVFGWIFGAHQLGAALAAWGAGAARTWLGDYQTAFVTAGLLSLVASGLVIRIARRAPGSRAAPEPRRPKPLHEAGGAGARRRRARRLARRRRRRTSRARRHARRVGSRARRRAPRVVVVRLSEAADPVGEGISVTGPDGREVATRAGVVRGRTLTRRDRARASEASYVVEWLVVGDDTHPARGAFVFSVGEPTRDRAAGRRHASGSCCRRSAAGSRSLGFALGFGVPFAALLSGGMTSAAVAARLGRGRSDDRGRAGRAARADGHARPVARLRSGARRRRSADELRPRRGAPARGRARALGARRRGAPRARPGRSGRFPRSARSSRIVHARTRRTASRGCPRSPSLLLGGAHVAAFAAWLGCIVVAVAEARGRLLARPGGARRARCSSLSGAGARARALGALSDLVETAYGEALGVKLALVAATFALGAARAARRGARGRPRRPRGRERARLARTPRLNAA